jgi:peptidoglycan-N-acetylglucosamine deacetylase
MRLSKFYFNRIPTLADAVFPDLLFRKRDNRLYLTLDDAPSPATPDLLSLLIRYHIRATFFLIGKHIETYPDLAEQIVQSGHHIANHSFSHQARYTPAELEAEITRTELLLHGLNGNTVSRTSLFRFPYGRFNHALRQSLKKQHTQGVMWSVMPGDFDESVSAERLAHHLRNARGGDIIVLHDSVKTIAKLSKALPMVLEPMLEKFQFELL